MASEDSSKKDEVGLGHVVAQHYNQLPEKGLADRSQSRIYHLRNFNNWIKSMLIGEVLKKLRQEAGSQAKITVLDIGSGKGGDLLKWKKGQIKHLVCADIAETSLEQLLVRYKDMMRRHERQREQGQCFTVELVPADCTKVRIKEKYKDPHIQFDLVSCQFTFHYCFESLPQAECMLQNVSECLRPGGYFIGTTPDSYDLVKRLRAAPGLSFGNDVFTVKFKCEDNLPLFGAEYDFHLEGVVDCPEFLVYFPMLEELASKYALKLVYKKRFEEYFDEYQKTEDGSFLLSKMQALETYPPFEGQQLVSSDPSDYEVAKKKVAELQQNKDENPNPRQEIRVGTLSKSEWEALSLYVVFVFVKVKPEVETALDLGSTSSENS